MDPITAALNAFSETMKLYGKILDLMTPEQREKYFDIILADMKATREFFKPLLPHIPKGDPT